MILYHFTDVDVEILIPYIGQDRHGGEDPNAVNKPVVWLTTCPNTYSSKMKKYRYSVEVDKNDKHLHLDRPFDQLMRDSKFIGIEDPTRWFFYDKNISPFKKEVWDGKSYN